MWILKIFARVKGFTKIGEKDLWSFRRIIELEFKMGDFLGWAERERDRNFHCTSLILLLTQFYRSDC